MGNDNNKINKDNAELNSLKQARFSVESSNTKSFDLTLMTQGKQTQPQSNKGGDDK